MTTIGRYQASLVKIAKSAALAALLTPGVFAARPAQAQGYNVLHSFAGGAGGATPHAGLVVDASGNLYGTTTAGGASDLGTVFMLDTTNKQTVLLSFAGGSDGATPNSNLVLDAAGNLWGTTSAGGTSNLGTVFKLDPANIETVLHSFTGGADGATPHAGLVLDPAGNLFGTTSAGGAANSGTIFELDAAGTEAVLYTFTGGADGGDPESGLILDASGNLYGTTASGGSTLGLCGYGGGCGVVFELDASNAETVLYTFGDVPAAYYSLAGLLLDGSGNLYGTTVAGGPSDGGVVFKLDPAGVETALYSFGTAANGLEPRTSVLLDQWGNLYGTTSAGASGFGTVFELDTAGEITVLHTFAGGADGATPYGDLALDGSGNLYGTSSAGGTANVGTVFQITPDFLLSASGLTPGTVNAGASSSATVNIKALSAFNGSVALTCSVSPSPALAPKCSISPGTVTAGTPAILTVSTTGATASASSTGSNSAPLYGLWFPMMGVAAGVGFRSDKKRKGKTLRALLASAVFAGLVLGIACGGGSGGGTTRIGGTPAGIYTITVTGTPSSSSLAAQSTLRTLTVR